MWWTPYGNDTIYDSRLDLEGARWWRWEFRTKVCNVSFEREGHCVTFVGDGGCGCVCGSGGSDGW